MYVDQLADIVNEKYSTYYAAMKMKIIDVKPSIYIDVGWKNNDKDQYYLKATIMVIMFWDFLIFWQIHLSPKVKRSVIISNKHRIYQLPHELPNNLRLRILEN